MNEVERAFAAALERDPNDAASRSVYADWLEEQGRSFDAMIVRADPPPRAYLRLVQRELVQTLDAIARRHGRWARGAAIEISSWSADTPDALLDDAERFLRDRRWDPEESEPVEARSELLAGVRAVRGERAPTTIVPPPSYGRHDFLAQTELVVHTYAIDGRAQARPAAPIDGVVTIMDGFLQASSFADRFAVRLDPVDARALTRLANEVAMQPVSEDGDLEHTVTAVRMTHFHPHQRRAPVACTLLAGTYAGAPLARPWRRLVELVVEILRSRRSELSPSWDHLASRC